MLHKDTIYGSDSMFFVFVIKEHDFYCLFYLTMRHTETGFEM